MHLQNFQSDSGGTTYKSYCIFCIVFPSLQCIANIPLENLLLIPNFPTYYPSVFLNYRWIHFSCEPAVIRICNLKKRKYEKSLFQKCP